MSNITDKIQEIEEELCHCKNVSGLRALSGTLEILNVGEVDLEDIRTRLDNAGIA